MLKWKVFFWLGVVATIANVMLGLYEGKPIIAIAVSTLITGVLLIPYYGYAYQKVVANLVLWKVLFWLQAILLAFILFFALIGQVSYLAGDGGFSLKLLGSVLILLLCPLTLVPPFRYAYRSKTLWNTAH